MYVLMGVLIVRRLCDVSPRWFSRDVRFHVRAVCIWKSRKCAYTLLMSLPQQVRKKVTSIISAASALVVKIRKKIMSRECCSEWRKDGIRLKIILAVSVSVRISTPGNNIFCVIVILPRNTLTDIVMRLHLEISAEEYCQNFALELRSFFSPPSLHYTR